MMYDDDFDDLEEDEYPGIPSSRNLEDANESASNKTSFQKFREKIIDLISRHPNLIVDVKSVIDALLVFRSDKEKGGGDPLVFLNGGLSIFDAFKNNNLSSPWTFIDKKNLEELHYKNVNVAFLFYDILSSYPHHNIKFLDSSIIKVFETQEGPLYLYSVNKNENYLYYDLKKSDNAKLTKMLVNAKIKALNSSFLIYHKPEDANTYLLTTFTPNIKVSKKAEEYLEHIKQFTNAGINRSILFYGPPGTGKTVLTNTILGQLNYRTLVFSASYKVNALNILAYIIELFDIEAVVIDDIDQLGDGGQILDLFEMLNKKMKLVVGIANSLRGFHPAVLRPGRFDEVELVTSLDDDCIRGVLGKYAKKYMPLVKHWPIAYINELMKRAQFSNSKQLKQHYNELNQRVLDQLEALGD